MPKYKTKPCTIEAIQWTDNTTEIKEFCGENCTYTVQDAVWEVGKGVPKEELVIHTLEGNMVASRGDYIIKGLRKEFYPCKPDVFEKKYELLESEELTKEAIQERRRANGSMQGICERYTNDVREYLMSKFPYISYCEAYEAAVFATDRFILSMYDVLAERDREWKAAYRRREKPVTHYGEEE